MCYFSPKNVQLHKHRKVCHYYYLVYTRANANTTAQHESTDKFGSQLILLFRDLRQRPFQSLDECVLVDELCPQFDVHGQRQADLIFEAGNEL